MGYGEAGTPGPIAQSGLIFAAAVDPRNSSVMYLGAAGGVWKTTDGGQTWLPLTDDQPSLEIGALALDPNNPDIVYAGTIGLQRCARQYRSGNTQVVRRGIYLDAIAGAAANGTGSRSGRQIAGR